MAAAFVLVAVAVGLPPQARAQDDQQTHDLTLMATTEIHAHLMPWDYYNDERDETIGLAKTYTLIKQAREQYDNTMLFDTGDILQGAFIGEFVAHIEPLEPGEVHPAIAAMNLMDYDSLTLGNHEFDFGLDFLEQVLADANFPAISANVYRVDEDGEVTEPYVDPYVVVETEVDGIPLRVGVIGITPPGIMQWHRERLEGRVDTLQAIEALEYWIPEMHAREDVDLTLLAPHAGKRLELGPDAVINPQGENWLWFAAEQFAGDIDAIVFGHEQSVFPGDAKYDGVEGLDNERGLIHGIPAVMAGAFGDHLGLVHLELTHEDGEWSVVDGWAENIPVTPETEDAPEIVEAVSEHHEATIEYVRSPVGETEVPIAHFFSRVMDTTALELINRAQMWAGEELLAETEWEDLPILSAAAPFRAGRVGPQEFTHIPPGEVTVRQIADLYIYPNRLYIVALDGEQIIDVLEHSAENFNQIDPNETGEQNLLAGIEPFNYDVIDGIEYEIDVTQPLGERIVNATFEGEPLTADMEFALVTNDYRATGGGNFPHLDGSNTIIETDEANRAALVRYVTEQGTITEPADHNWSILPVDVAGPVTFRSSPDAAEFIEAHDVPGVSFVEERDGWGIYEYEFPELGEPVDPVDVTSDRLWGADRAATAADIALDLWGDSGSDTVVVTTGQNFPDALAANYLAGQLAVEDETVGVPILLTRTASLPAVTSDALAGLDAQEVVIVGGPHAVSESVEEELAEDYQVDRVYGDNRFETAAAAALAGDFVGELDGEATALLATGANYPDALAAGPVAFAGDFPLLLTHAASLHPSTADALDELGIERVVILGGPAAVSSNVRGELEDLGYATDRVWGANRAATAVAVADLAEDVLDFDPAQVDVAAGWNYPDALAGGPHAGVTASPILLTRVAPNVAPSAAAEIGVDTLEYVEDRCADVAEVLLFGGPAAVSEAAENALTAAGTC